LRQYAVWRRAVDHKSYAVCKEILIMKERYGLERELEALGVRSPLRLEKEIKRSDQTGLRELFGPIIPPLPPSLFSTVGFEFDLNYGFEEEVAQIKGAVLPGTAPSPGWTDFRWPRDYLKVTDHEHKDMAKTKLKDGFVATMDGPRMEISTIPIRIHNDSEFNTVVDNVLKFGQELIRSTKTLEPRSVRIPGVTGPPTTFGHPQTVVNRQEKDAHGNIKFPGDRDKASYMRHPVPLVIIRKGVTTRSGDTTWIYPSERTELASSPQATLTLPLSEFGKLVYSVHISMKLGAPGVAFTGPKEARLGLRDDLAWFALTSVVEDRKRKLGTRLPDGTIVTDRDFTRSITSVVTILVMYMLTSILEDRYDRDKKKESYSKGSLPLNLKTPLWQIHKFVLTPHEKDVLHELYTDPSKRSNLYTLAHKAKTECIKASNGTVKASGGSASDENRKLFPVYTHVDVGRFHVDIPTWRTLIEALVQEKPVIVTKDPNVQKKGHKMGNEILIAPLSSKIDWNVTKPLIAVEMRRLGFDWVKFGNRVGEKNLWRGLMVRIRNLAKQVNP
jgi:hypothetical protein